MRKDLVCRSLPLAAVFLFGCSSSSSLFVCQTSSQCNAQRFGMCESSGYCAYPDQSCGSGYRYDPNSGPWSNACVTGVEGGTGPDMKLTDAALPDQPRLDAGPRDAAAPEAPSDATSVDAGVCVPTCGGGATCVKGVCVASACTGVVGLPQPPLVPVGKSPALDAVADFNGDGLDDVAVVNESDDTVSVLLAKGGGAFWPKVDVGTGKNPDWVAAGDLNGDGVPDLAVANAGEPTVSVLLNATPKNGTTASFSSTPFGASDGPGSVVIADFDGDTVPDIAVGTDLPSPLTPAVNVLINKTPKNAAAPAFVGHSDFAVAAAGAYAGTIGAADLNSDSKIDLMVEVTNGTSGWDYAVFNQTAAPGSVSFTSSLAFTSATRLALVGLADINGDGRADLIAGDAGSNLSVLVNQTTGGTTTAVFGAPTVLSPGGEPYRTAFPDLNGDGLADVTTVQYTGDLLSVFLNSTPHLSATPSFAPEMDYPTASAPDGIAAGDFNGDGKLDLATGDSGDNVVGIFLNLTPNSAGTPDIPTAGLFGTASDPNAIVAGDLNQDGLPDLATAIGGSTAAGLGTIMNVLANQTPAGAGAPLFAPKLDVSSGGMVPEWLEAADLNGDGKLDLAVADQGAAGASTVFGVVLNQTASPGAAPLFSKVFPFTVGMEPQTPRAADFNADGLPDLAVDNFSSANVSVLLSTTAAGDTTPTFRGHMEFGTGNNPQGEAIADFNGDGLPDIATADLTPTPGTVTVLLDTTPALATAPSFSRNFDFDCGTRPYDVIAADLNADGRPDLITPNEAAAPNAGVNVLLNTTPARASAPTFANAVPVPLPFAATAVAAADLDRDGRPDLVVTQVTGNDQGNGNLMMVIYNLTAVGASTPSFAPPVAYPGALDSYGLVAADLNADGQTDLASTDHPANQSGMGTARVFLTQCLH
jgi:hypothetical protein